MQIYVYILRCADGSYYVGNTRGDLETRIGQHNAATFGGYTSKRRPVELVFAQESAATTTRCKFWHVAAVNLRPRMVRDGLAAGASRPPHHEG
jgi:hypothetical protein